MILQKLELGSFGSNCYLVGDDSTKEGIIIDPGAEGSFILKQVKACGLKIKTIVLTHSHMDHVGALAEVKIATGAEVAIHEDEAPFLQKQPRMAFLPQTPKPPSADRLLKEGDIITFGKIKLKVLHTPGHTRGGMCLVGDGIVFTGDTLFADSVGRTDFPGGSMIKLIDSIKTKLCPLPDETVCYPGHGPATTIAQEKKHNQYLK